MLSPYANLNSQNLSDSKLNIHTYLAVDFGCLKGGFVEHKRKAEVTPKADDEISVWEFLEVVNDCESEQLAHVGGGLDEEGGRGWAEEIIAEVTNFTVRDCNIKA